MSCPKPKIQQNERNVTLSALRGTDGSFQPVPSVTIVLFVVTALPCQAEL